MRTIFEDGPLTIVKHDGGSISFKMAREAHRTPGVEARAIGPDRIPELIEVLAAEFGFKLSKA